MTTQALPRPRLPLHFASSLRLRRPRPTWLLTATGIALLGSAVAISVAQVASQGEHTAVVSDLHADLSGHTATLDGVNSTIQLTQLGVAEYRALMLDQDAAFENVTGFLK